MWIFRRPAERFEMLFPVIAVLWMVPALAPPSKAPFPKSFEWFPSILFAILRYMNCSFASAVGWALTIAWCRYLLLE